MAKFKVNQKVYVPSLKKYGIVKEVNSSGIVTKVDIGTKVIETANLVIKVVNVLKLLINLIGSIFKKSK